MVIELWYSTTTVELVLGVAMQSEQPDPRNTTSSSPSVELITDAVIMAYIHEISPRHRPAEPGTELFGAGAEAA